jgi:hypothetical protein
MMTNTETFFDMAVVIFTEGPEENQTPRRR